MVYRCLKCGNELKNPTILGGRVLEGSTFYDADGNFHDHVKWIKVIVFFCHTCDMTVRMETDITDNEKRCWCK